MELSFPVPTAPAEALHSQRPNLDRIIRAAPIRRITVRGALVPLQGARPGP